MYSRVYINVAATAIILAVMCYSVCFILFDRIDAATYWHMQGFTRALFCWGAMYASFEAQQHNRNYLTALLLKWILVYATGVMSVRFVFDFFVSNKVCNAEIWIIILGAFATVFLALKSWRDDHT